MMPNNEFFMFEDDTDTVDFEASTGPDMRINDDTWLEPAAQNHIQSLLESMVRIGGEVSRLRAEMDGLLDQNSTLIETFENLKEVIAAKGTLNLEDFDLACEVMEANTEALSKTQVRRMAN
jgi:hypothetical protein